MTGKSSWGDSLQKDEERKQKLSEKMSGENNPMFGKPNGHQGKPLSDCVKKVLSSKLKGRVFSEETRKKMSEAQKGNKNACRKKADFNENYKD